MSGAEGLRPRSRIRPRKSPSVITDSATMNDAPASPPPNAEKNVVLGEARGRQRHCKWQNRKSAVTTPRQSGHRNNINAATSAINVPRPLNSDVIESDVHLRRKGRRLVGPKKGRQIIEKPTLTAEKPAIVPAQGKFRLSQNCGGSAGSVENSSVPTVNLTERIRKQEFEPPGRKVSLKQIDGKRYDGLDVMEELRLQQYVCGICVEPIIITKTVASQNSAVWDCRQCFAVYHLACIRKWAAAATKTSSTETDTTVSGSPSTSIAVLRHNLRIQVQPSLLTAIGEGTAPATGQQIMSTSESGSQNLEWVCPNCRKIYPLSAASKSTCWCGGIRVHEDAPLLMNSCGERCPRKETPQGIHCGHPCLLECHAGPCKKCQAFPLVRCYCGRTTRRMACGSGAFSCGCKCGQVLSCGRHRCDQICHSGPCSSCSFTEWKSCRCGALIRKVSCNEVDFSCDGRCDGYLDCGKHACLAICHSPVEVLDRDTVRAIPSTNEPFPLTASTISKCRRPCPRQPENMELCACGAKLVANNGRRYLCTDPLLSCGGRCKKFLDCGHECPLNCHEGFCGPCTAETTLTCRCGRNVTRTKCATLVQQLAELSQKSDNITALSAPAPTAVQNVLQVNGLKFNVNGSEFRCNRVCSTLKSCRVHRCKEICCGDRSTLSNALGPSGSNHICLETCTETLLCGHSCGSLCHSGSCPPCRVVTRPPVPCGCGRTTISLPRYCHEKPVTCNSQCGKIRPGCGHLCPSFCHHGPCPPCSVLVNVKCVGHGEPLTALCSDVVPALENSSLDLRHEGPSCRKKCNKPLITCGHLCCRPCHAGPCKPCTSRCSRKRNVCKHLCRAVCHGAKSCPEVPCPVMTMRLCRCGSRSRAVVCGEFSNGAVSNDDTNVVVKEGKILGEKCIAQESMRSEIEMAKFLECDEKCALLRRARDLADAFSDGSDTSVMDQRDVYPIHLVQWARRNLPLLSHIEQSLERIIIGKSNEWESCWIQKCDQCDLLDYYIQRHFLLETRISERKAAAVRFHVCPEMRPPRLPNPQLSAVAMCAGNDREEALLEKYALDEDSIAVMAGGNILEMRDLDPTSVPLRAIARALLGVSNDWIVSFSSGIVNRRSRDFKWLYSPLSLRRCNVRILARNASISARLLIALQRYPTTFGPVTIAPNRQTRMLTQKTFQADEACCEDNGAGDAGWQTVTKRHPRTSAT